LVSLKSAYQTRVEIAGLDVSDATTNLEALRFSADSNLP